MEVGLIGTLVQNPVEQELNLDPVTTLPRHVVALLVLVLPPKIAIHNPAATTVVLLNVVTEVV